MKYTYSDDEDDFYTDSTRRSTRNTRNHTPAEPAGPVITASGRQVRAPTRLNAETSSNGGASASVSVQGDAQYGEDVEMKETSVGPTGRPRRSAAVNHGTNGWTTSKKRKSEEYESDEEDGSEPDFGDDEEEAEHVPDDDDEEEEDLEEEPLEDDNIDLVDTAPPPRLIVKLSVKKAVDQNGKEKLIPSVTLPAKESPRPAHARRDVVMSDDDDSDGDQPTADTSVQPAEEIPAEESISVATKGAAAATTSKENMPPTSTPAKAMTPPTTSLAFRGSPEKTPVAPRSIDVGGRE